LKFENNLLEFRFIKF